MSILTDGYHFVCSTQQSICELKANTFNRLFSRSAFVDDSGKDLPDGVIPPDIPTIDHIDITIDDVMGQLSALDPSKAYGPDGLGPRLLKELQ